MSNVKVYTINNCPFCDKAKNLLKQRDLTFEEVKLSLDDHEAVNALRAETKMRTFPQILNKGELIGGYSDLAELDGSDQLESLK